jgi:hypothetical protein
MENALTGLKASLRLEHEVETTKGIGWTRQIFAKLTLSPRAITRDVERNGPVKTSRPEKEKELKSISIVLRTWKQN